MSYSSKLVTLYKPTSEIEFSLISSLLEEAKIPYMVKNSEVQDLFGVGRIGSGYNFVTGPMVSQVDENNLLSARKVITEFIENSESIPESETELELPSTFNLNLNMSILLGIIFPGLGIYHLVKAIDLKRKSEEPLKGNAKLLSSILVFLLGCILLLVMIFN